MQKEKRVSSSVQKTGDVIKPENFHQMSDSETEHLESSCPSGNNYDGKSFTHKKDEVRVKPKEKKMRKVHKTKDLKRPKKTKFEEFLEMDTPKALISGDEDVELERKLAKKLKVKKGKLRGLDDGLNDLFEGLPSLLDSMRSEIGDSRKERKRKRSEEKQDHEVVDNQANEDLEHEESDFSDEASEEENHPEKHRKQQKKKKKKSLDEELESHPMEITDRGESETVNYHDSPSSLEKVEPPLQEYKPESKYVAPRFRSQARSEPEEHTKIRTRIKGIANKSCLSSVFRVL